MPRWNVDHELNPDTWDVGMVFGPDPKPTWMSRVSFNQYGLVGVDVKSHQTSTSIPYTVITHGNDEQDTHCKGVLARDKPPDIFLSSGGPLPFLCGDGRLITTIPNKFIRNLIRHQSMSLMATKFTQGNPPQVQHSRLHIMFCSSTTRTSSSC